MFRWYVVNTYSGHENKVKQNLEHRVVSLGQKRNVRQVVVPTETVSEMKDNQKVTVEKRTISGPLSDFSGEISEINEDAGRLKVLVSIFGRETPVEVGFDQVKKV